MTTPQKGRIFISYRRADSAGYAGRIYDRLVAHFGEDAIFMDVDTIEGGVDFVKVLEDAIQSCDLVIALIGRQWLNIKDKDGKRRLDNPEDFVRIEIATALKRNIRVIPVLVDGVSMPFSTELPDNLKALARRNALQVNHHSFNPDARRLIEHSESGLNEAEKSRILKARAIEKASREKAEKESTEKAASEKEAAEKAAREKQERKDALRNQRDEFLSTITVFLKSLFSKRNITFLLLGAAIITSILFGIPALEKRGSAVPEPTKTISDNASATNTQIILPTETHQPISTSPAVDTSSSPTETLTPSATPTIEGYLIGYFVDQGESYDLYTVNETGEETKLAEGLRENQFAISANGQYLAESKDGIIYYTDLFSGEKGPLIDSVYQRDYENLSWSNDGKYLFAVARGYIETSSWTKFYTINTANGEIKAAVELNNSHDTKNAAWSPDSLSVAYWEGGNIYSINIETGETTQQTAGSRFSDIPFAWSPDGTYLALVTNREDSLILHDINTQEQQVFLENIRVPIYSLYWNPNNDDEIIYSTSSQIFLYNLQSKESTLFTNGYEPRWSLDHTRLFFLRDGDIHTITPQGSEEIKTTNSPTIPKASFFGVDVLNSFVILTEDMVTESYTTGSSTFCSWTTSWNYEYQCACSAEWCSCTVFRSTFTSRGNYPRKDVDSNVQRFGGVCEEIVVGP